MSNDHFENRRACADARLFRLAGIGSRFEPTASIDRARATVCDSRKTTGLLLTGRTDFFGNRRRRTNLARKPSQPDEDGAFAASSQSIEETPCSARLGFSRAGRARAAERHDRAISATPWSGHGAAARPASTRDSLCRGAPPEVSPGAEPERNIRSFRDGVE
jgi:hypothetical protein